MDGHIRFLFQKNFGLTRPCALLSYFCCFHKEL